MKIISDKDRYIATTWGAAVRLEAGVPKVVGEQIGLLCLQEGCKRVEEIKDVISGTLKAKKVNTKEDKEITEENI